MEEILVSGARLRNPDLTKFVLIVERQPAVTRETKNHSRSFRRCFVVVEELKRPGHPEMQPQPKLITGAHKQMFGAGDVFEAAPFQSPCQLTHGNLFQDIRVPHLDTAIR